MLIMEKFQILKDKGLSIKFLANLCGIKESLMYKWSSEKAKLSTEKIKIINSTIDNLYNLYNNNEKANASIAYEDLTGQQFNHLTALYPVGANKNGQMQWACQCDCGNPILKITTSYCLKNNETISCGCQRVKNGGKNFKDLTGMKFGLLTVLERYENDKSDRVQWICQCDCGKKCYKRSHDLLSHKVISCGCFNQSKGEKYIKNLLDALKLDYKEQYSFEDLISPKQYKLKFDFAIFNKFKQIDKLIEIDGIQHFEPYHFNGTLEDFNYQQKCDMLKNSYCKKHQFLLIRIPYDAIYSIKTEKDLYNYVVI